MVRDLTWKSCFGWDLGQIGACWRLWMWGLLAQWEPGSWLPGTPSLPDAVLGEGVGAPAVRGWGILWADVFALSFLAGWFQHRERERPLCPARGLADTGAVGVRPPSLAQRQAHPSFFLPLVLIVGDVMSDVACVRCCYTVELTQCCGQWVPSQWRAMSVCVASAGFWAAAVRRPVSACVR